MILIDISDAKEGRIVMILEVKQVSANGRNLFEVIREGNVIYHGSASWYPMGVDQANKVVLTDPNGNMVFQTKYSVTDNIAESSVPFKYLFTGEQKFHMYQVADAAGNIIGSFFEVQKSMMDVRLCLSFDNRVIFGYQKSVGYREVVSFYENDVQVGQLTRSNKVVDHLDHYFVHFVSPYDELLPLVAMFIQCIMIISSTTTADSFIREQPSVSSIPMIKTAANTMLILSV